jgi:hypothetical protein
MEDREALMSRSGKVFGRTLIGSTLGGEQTFSRAQPARGDSRPYT